MIVRFVVIVSIALFGVSCSTSYRNLNGGFGSSTLTKNDQLRTKQIIKSLDSFEVESDTIFGVLSSIHGEQVFLLEYKIKNIKNTDKQTVYSLKNQRKKEVENKKGVDRTIKNIGKIVAKIGFFSSIIGLISGRLIFFSIMGLLLGIISLLYKAKFRTKIFAYLAIFFGVLGLISPVLTTVLLILIVVLMILLMLKWMHWY